MIIISVPYQVPIKVHYSSNYTNEETPSEADVQTIISDVIGYGNASYFIWPLRRGSFISNQFWVFENCTYTVDPMGYEFGDIVMPPSFPLFSHVPSTTTGVCGAVSASQIQSSNWIHKKGALEVTVGHL